LKFIDNIMVSTDSKEIADVAVANGVDFWFLRPAELATDSAPKVPVIRHSLVEAEKHYECRFDVIIDLDITSPLRISEDISGAYEKFLEGKFGNLFAVCKSRKNPYFNMIERQEGKFQLVKKIIDEPSCRQNAPEVFDIHASIYIWTREVLLSTDTLYTENTGIYIVPQERSLDLDTDLDWLLVEHLMSVRSEGSSPQ
jgi:CMP-N,N'-diacetyllegionaminic acid synthase